MGNGNCLLKVISYNIHSGKDFFMKPQLHKMIEFLNHEQAHIIGIQEINENDKRGYQVDKMKTDLQMNSAFAQNVKIGNGYYGVGIFTPFEIIKTEHILLPSSKEQRGLLHTILKIGHMELNVLNTHLGLNGDKRIRQLEAIENYLGSIDSPFILMGDFNTTNPEFNDLMIIDTAKAMKKDYLSTFIYPNKRIDFIFLSKSIQIRNYQVIPVRMSDHYPIIVEIMIYP